MNYRVTYRIGADESVDEIEAADAASAVSTVRLAHADDDGQFELIAVQMEDVDAEERQLIANDETPHSSGSH